MIKSIDKPKVSMRGFTLIELLVVISIIGLLSSLVLVSLKSVRGKTRDARRISDMRQIRLALELYFSRHSQYPAVDAARTGDESDGCGPGSRWCDLETELSRYFTVLPRDPSGLQNNYRYYYDADSGDNYQNYGLMSRMENDRSSDLVEFDGGYFNDPVNLEYYETGEHPAYCMGVYSGTGRDWWSGGPSNVCLGGN